MFDIAHLDLRAVRRRLMDTQGWTFDEAEVACDEYRRHLAQVAEQPGEAVAPTERADEAWHTHIYLDTLQYTDDCNRLLGFYLHHRPAVLAKCESVPIVSETQCESVPQAKCESVPATAKAKCESVPVTA